MVINVLKSYSQAQKELELLTEYIRLIDNFEIKNLDDLIIYQYAIYNSISKVIKSIKNTNNSFPFTVEYEKITHSLIKNTILSSPQNQLHAVIKKGYIKKTQPQRNRKIY